MTAPLDLGPIERRHAEYRRVWDGKPAARPSTTMMAITACATAEDVPKLIAEIKRLCGAAS